MVIRSADGYWRCTRALATRRIAATRSATLVGVDLQQRRAEPDLCGVEHLIAGHRPDPGDDDAACRHRRREVEDQPERNGEHGQPDRRKHQLQAPDRPARNGFGRDRGAARGPGVWPPGGPARSPSRAACAARRSARSRLARRRGPSKTSSCSGAVPSALPASSSASTAAGIGSVAVISRNGSPTVSPTASPGTPPSCSVTTTPPAGPARCGWPAPAARSRSRARAW